MINHLKSPNYYVRKNFIHTKLYAYGIGIACQMSVSRVLQTVS